MATENTNQKDMKTGIELIAEERREQIEKHGRTLENDFVINDVGQLAHAAEMLLGRRTRRGHRLSILSRWMGP